jgi:bacterioferritin-associated ferredoxin
MLLTIILISIYPSITFPNVCLTMYVCICQQITESQIRQRCQSGQVSMADLRNELGLAADCGRCGKYARQIIAESASGPQLSAMTYAA